MSALSVIQANLIDEAPDLVTNTTGGTSLGNPSAGTTNGEGSATTDDGPVTTGGKAGAGILTAFVLGLLLAGIAFMISGG